MAKHTILLTQVQGRSSRTYADFPTVTQCMRGTNQLKRMNPHMSHITYTVNDIFNYLDSMNECNLLVYDLDIVFINLGLNH